MRWKVDPDGGVRPDRSVDFGEWKFDPDETGKPWEDEDEWEARAQVENMKFEFMRQAKLARDRAMKTAQEVAPKLQAGYQTYQKADATAQALQAAIAPAIEEAKSAVMLGVSLICFFSVGGVMLYKQVKAPIDAVFGGNAVEVDKTPVEKGDRIGVFTITSGFGMRTHPVTGEQKMHEGVDVDTPTGHPLISPIAGTLSCEYDPNGYGNFAQITPASPTAPGFLAGHLSECGTGAVNIPTEGLLGNVVRPGQVIGITGNTGRSTGAHLHWEEFRPGSTTPVKPTKGYLSIALGVSPATTEKAGSMVDFIAKHEGVVLTPYADSGGIATIGYGATTYEDGRPVSLSDPAIDENRAKKLLKHHLKVSEDIVRDAVKVPLNENQKTALVSFAFNTGTIPDNIAQAINSGNLAEAGRIMNSWIHDAAGNRLPGLVSRRQEETSLLLGNVDKKQRLR